MTVRTAVIPAGGWGTRLLPATKAVPKELLAVLDKPVLQYVVEQATASGIERIIVITSEGKDAMRVHLENHAELEAMLQAKGNDAAYEAVHDVAGGAELVFITQHEQKGLGDAVRLARDAVAGEPFAVMLGDTIIGPDDGQPAGTKQLIDVFEQQGASVVGLRKVPREWVSRYGIVDGQALADEERTLRLARLVEKPSVDAAPTDLAIAGRYVFTPAIFDELEDAERVAAIGLLGLRAEQRGKDIDTLRELLTPQHSPAIQKRAIAALVRIPEAASAEALVENWGSFGPASQAIALDALVSRNEWIAQVLDGIEAGLIQPALLDAARRERLMQLPDAELAARAAELLANFSSDREAVIGFVERKCS